MYRLQLGKPVTTVPTVGFNVETIKCNKLTLDLWVRWWRELHVWVNQTPHAHSLNWRLAQDVGGQDRLRPYWRHHYTGTQVHHSPLLADNCG